MKSPKYLMISALVAGAAAVSVAPAIASADAPNHPLLTTTCTYDQVQAAIKADNPKAATALDKHPKAQERLRKILAMTPQERQAKYDSFSKSHPKAAARLADGPKVKKVRAVLDHALATCGQ